MLATGTQAPLKHRPLETPLKSVKPTVSYREGMRMVNEIMQRDNSDIKKAAEKVFAQSQVLRLRGTGPYPNALRLTNAAYNFRKMLTKKRRSPERKKVAPPAKVVAGNGLAPKIRLILDMEDFTADERLEFIRKLVK